MVKSVLATQSVDVSAKSNPRGNNKILRITPHHMAGRMLADDCARMHKNNSNQQSANYYIGYDGKICIGVSEDRRAWTSASRPNDFTAITFEVSNEKGAPNWTIPDAAYQSLVKLCADICTRYGIDPHYNGSSSGTITMHKMFQSTNCPGPTLEKLITSGQFEQDIKAAMGKDVKPEKTSGKALYRVQCGAFKVPENAKTLEGKLDAAGFDTYIVKVGELYKVQTGAFSNKKNADALVKSLKAKKFDAVITQTDAEAVRDGNDRIDPVEKLGYWIGNEYTVVVQRLNVRSGAGMDKGIAGTVQKGEKLTITDAAQVGSEVWVKCSKGWMCAIGKNGKYIA